MNTPTLRSSQFPGAVERVMVFAFNINPHIIRNIHKKVNLLSD
jgi:hypothetical protein